MINGSVIVFLDNDSVSSLFVNMRERPWFSMILLLCLSSLVIHHNLLYSSVHLRVQRWSFSRRFFNLRRRFCWRNHEIASQGRRLFASCLRLWKAMTSTFAGWWFFGFVTCNVGYLQVVSIRVGWRRWRQRWQTGKGWLRKTWLLLVLNPSILKPNLDLLLTEVESVSDFNSSKSRQIHVP